MMGAAPHKLDCGLARLVSAMTGKKAEKLESGLLMSVVPPRAGALP